MLSRRRRRRRPETSLAIIFRRMEIEEKHPARNRSKTGRQTNVAEKYNYVTPRKPFSVAHNVCSTGIISRVLLANVITFENKK